MWHFQIKRQNPLKLDSEKNLKWLFWNSKIQLSDYCASSKAKTKLRFTMHDLQPDYNPAIPLIVKNIIWSETQAWGYHCLRYIWVRIDICSLRYSILYEVLENVSHWLPSWTAKFYLVIGANNQELSHYHSFLTNFLQEINI